MTFSPCPKPAPRVKVPRPGPTARRRAQKRRIGQLAARAIKSLVKDMDGRACRWPDCQVPPDSFWGRLEAAHYRAAGMGGDPSFERLTVENLITLCRFHHTGPLSLHSGHVRMRPLTEQGMRGPVEFSAMEPGESGKWYVVGVSSPPRERVA